MREKCIKRVGEMKWILLLMVFLVAPADVYGDGTGYCGG